MIPALLLLPSLLLLFSSLAQAGAAELNYEDSLNFACLKQAYPAIDRLEAGEGGLYLVLKSGKRVLYAAKKTERSSLDLDVDVKDSMTELYPLEPARPDLSPGFSPGRKRSYALLRALYGENSREVKSSLVTVHCLGQRWSFAPEAAQAFLRAGRVLEAERLRQPWLRPWLISGGTFTWRLIAGERVLSTHSFGIAFDIGVKAGATYWRWNRLSPHPLQKTYASAIVRAFENEGFIWGGKWHEYDLMHFEYRPELICKSRRQPAF